MQAMNSLLSQQQQQQSLQELQNGNGSHASLLGFDPTDDFLEQILLSSSPWDPLHHLPPPRNPSSGDDPFYLDDNSSSLLLASKLRHHQITGGAAPSSAAKALLLHQQQQLLLSRAQSSAAGNNGFGLSSGNVDQNNAVANPANETSFQALFNGFTGSLSPAANQLQHLQGGSVPAQGFGSPAMNQSPAASGSTAPAAQPKPQRVRARRGQATDPHSIAERLRRERIAERMKSLQELVPNANKTDKASMLDEIIDYVKFLQLQVKVLSMSRLGGAAAVAPLVADMSLEGRGEGNGTAPSSMTVTEQQVAKLLEEDMGSAMQYLQGKGLCLMPISLATAISTATNPNAAKGTGPSSPNVSVLTCQSANAVKDATAVSDA